MLLNNELVIAYDMGYIGQVIGSNIDDVYCIEFGGAHELNYEGNDTQFLQPLKSAMHNMPMFQYEGLVQNTLSLQISAQRGYYHL